MLYLNEYRHGIFNKRVIVAGMEEATQVINRRIGTLRLWNRKRVVKKFDDRSFRLSIGPDYQWAVRPAPVRY